MTVPTPVWSRPDDAVRQAQLDAMKRRATGLLALAAAVFGAATAFEGQYPWLGYVRATAEASLVGGLADWFAVTALFRRPLGLPIPHTALIPANWELMAARVGTMVGSRVLTKEYVAREIARVDVSALIARAAERITARDLDVATRELARWLSAELSAKAAGDAVTRLRDLLLAHPLSPTLAGALAEALERPALRETVGDLVDDVLGRYRERMGAYPRFWMGVASLLGLLDRDRAVAAIQSGLREVVRDPDHPLRRRITDTLGELPERLRRDTRLAARVEKAKVELLATPVATRVLEDAAVALRGTLLSD